MSLIVLVAVFFCSGYSGDVVCYDYHYYYYYLLLSLSLGSLKGRARGLIATRRFKRCFSVTDGLMLELHSPEGPAVFFFWGGEGGGYLPLNSPQQVTARVLSTSRLASS